MHLQIHLKNAIINLVNMFFMHFTIIKLVIIGNHWLLVYFNDLNFFSLSVLLYWDMLLFLDLALILEL